MQKTYSRHVGEKFNPDGSARAFPGNTVICPVAPMSNTMQIITALHDDILDQVWHENYAILPPSSYHMTVFELVCDQVRKAEAWTTLCALDAPLEEVDAMMLSRWQEAPPAPLPSMRFDQLLIGDYITLRLAPKDEASNRMIRDYRDKLSTVFGFRQPQHDSYGFHISLAYRITALDEQEETAIAVFVQDWIPRLTRSLAHIELAPPQLTFFADMTNFAPTRASARQNVQK